MSANTILIADGEVNIGSKVYRIRRETRMTIYIEIMRVPKGASHGPHSVWHEWYSTPAAACGARKQ